MWRITMEINENPKIQIYTIKYKKDMMSTLNSVYEVLDKMTRDGYIMCGVFRDWDYLVYHFYKPNSTVITVGE